MDGMDQDLLTLINAIMQNQAAYGALMAVSVAIYGLVNLFRAPWCQALLPFKYQWDNWKRPVQFAFVLSFSTIAQICATAATHAPWYSGILPGLVAGLASMGLKVGAKIAAAKKENV